MGAEVSHTFEVITFNLSMGWLEDEAIEDDGEIGQLYVVRSALGAASLRLFHVHPPFLLPRHVSSVDYQAAAQEAIDEDVRLLEFKSEQRDGGVESTHSLTEHFVSHPTRPEEPTTIYRALLLTFVDTDNGYSFAFQGRENSIGPVEISNGDEAYPPEHPLSLIRAAISDITFSAAKVVRSAA